MSLLSPWYLLAALGIALPVWVHLIRQERARPVLFASLMFFRRIPQRITSRRRLSYLLLLAARCALLLLIALAFARPFFTATEPPKALGAQSRLFVIAVDRSLSMQYADRAARAAEAARGVVAKMAALDQAQVIAFDADARVLNGPTSDRGTLRGLIESDLKPTALPTSYATALRAIEKLAASSKLPANAFLISDFQKSGWTPGSGAPNLPAGASLELIAVDGSARPNFAVSELRVSRETFQPRYPRPFQVRVNGYGTAAAKKDLVLTLNGREVGRRKVDIPDGGAATVVFESFELPPGPSRGELRLMPPDELPQDDVRHFTLVRREPYRILYLTASDSQRELLYLREALSAGDDAPFSIESRPLSASGGESLHGYVAVVLSNASSLPGRLGPRLKEYIEQGGGAFVILGDRSDFASLSRSMPGLLPAGEGEKIYVRRDKERFVTLGDFRRDHYIFQPFNDRAAGGLLATRFFGYFRLRASDDTAVLARFSTSDPALLEKSSGRGRVLLLASAPDNVWSDFPLHAGFVPLVNQAARYLAGMRDEPAAHTVPSTVALDNVRGAALGRSSFVVVNPAGKRQGEFSEGKGGYARLDEVGFYEVRHSRTTDFLAANTEPRESDLTPLSAEDRALLMRAGIAAAASSPDPAPASTPRDKEKRQNLWWTLLVAATLIAVAESVLGNIYLRRQSAQVDQLGEAT